MLKPFVTHTTKKFKLKVTYNGETPDITNDTVTIIFKKTPNPTSSVELSVDADTTTEGVNGVANFHIDAATNTLTPGVYYYEITWSLANGVDKYVLTEPNSRVKVLPSIS